MKKVAAVIVTHNRLNLLIDCIDAIRNQTRKLDEIIVIDNSSTDGTNKWLQRQNDLTIITQENSGSAGGQYTGIKYAFEKKYDLIWSIDCDVIPNRTALEKLIKVYEEFNSKTKIGFLSSTIYFKDGNLAYINIPEIRDHREVFNSIYKKEPIPIITASFGSILIPRHVIKKIGFPCKDFFIWGDDVEYTLRIIKNGFIGYLILESLAEHKNEINHRDPFVNIDIRSKKFVYGLRNLVYNTILRNEIVYNSRFRGILSSLMLFIRIYKQRQEKNIFRRIEIISFLSTLFIKGLLFRPKIKFLKD